MDNNQPGQIPQQVEQPSPQPVPPPATPVAPTPSTPPISSEKKPISKLVLIIIIILVLICIVASLVIAYKTILNPNKTSESSRETTEQSTSPSPTPFDSEGTPSPTASPFDVQAAIESALADQTYETLIPYMAESVQFEIEASEAVGPGNPQQTVTNLAYLDTAVAPWTFDQTDPRIVQIKTDNAQEYGALFIGISSNDVLAAFGTDTNNKINIIKVAATYEFLVAPAE